MKKIFWLFLICFISACQTQKEENLYVGHWVEVMPVNKHIIQGVSLYEDGTASSIGMKTLQYEKWKIDGQKIILTGKSIGNGQTIDFQDDFDVLEISPYSMKLGKFGQYRVDYYRVDKIPDVNDMENLPNLLQKFEGAGDLQKRVFKGVLPAASNPGIDYTLTLYNYENSGDGVFHARLTYLEAQNGKDETFEFSGRQYTLKGSFEDKNAVVFQFVPFQNGEETMNFLYQKGKLTMLDRDLKTIQSSLNYSLSEQ